MISITIDTTNLAKGIRFAADYSKKTLAQVSNTAAYWVTYNAKNLLPYVTPEKVDKELSIVATPVIGKRGKALKHKKTYGVASAPGEVPFAALIIQARSKSGSRYNQLTGGRYALVASPFKDRTREAGRAAMRALIDKMVKVRHKSGRFLRAGWNNPLRVLRAFAMARLSSGGLPKDNEKTLHDAQFGDAKPAREGETCEAMIENAIGTGHKANQSSHNRALLTYGGPALQRAIDHEGTRQMDYGLKKMGEEMERAVNKMWG